MIALVAASSQYCESTSVVSPPDETTGGTVCFWVYPTNLTGTQGLFTVNNDSAYSVRFLGTTLQSRMCRKSSKSTDSITTFANNTLYHVAVRFTNGAAANNSTNGIYINGALDVEEDDTDDTPSVGPMQLGEIFGGNYFNGWVGDLRLYRRFLNVEEIETIYQLRGTDGIVHGLQHWWPFNEGAPAVAATGTGVLKDWTGGNHVTPFNSPTWQFDGQMKWRRIA